MNTFRKLGEYYRRDDEIHHVNLYQSPEIVDKLCRVGFQVKMSHNYEQFNLPKAHSVFIAHKLI